MSNLDDYFMWMAISVIVTIIFVVIYMNVSFLKKYGITGIIIGTILIVVSINLAQWKTGYVSPIPTYRLY